MIPKQAATLNTSNQPDDSSKKVPAEAINRIMVAIESENRLPLKKAMSLAALLRADLRVVSVLEPVAPLTVEGMSEYAEISQDRRQRAADMLQHVVASIPSSHHPSSDLREGNAVDEIIRAATEWKADILVIGRHRRGPLERLFVGSTSKGVIKAAPCAVLVVRDELVEKVPLAQA